LGYYSFVANNNSKSAGRTRINPITKEVETVAGTKAGKKGLGFQWVIRRERMTYMVQSERKKRRVFFQMMKINFLL